MAQSFLNAHLKGYVYMPSRSHCWSVAALAFVLLGSTAHAASAPGDLIDYVDATDGPGGNTRLATGGVFTATPYDVGPAQADNNWSLRNFANGGTVFTSNDFGFEDAPGLVTTLENLTPGQPYRVYAYLWVDSLPPSNWRLKASLTTAPPLPDDPAVSFGKLASALTSEAPPAEASDFNTTILPSEGNRTLLQASLGVATADSNGELRVWIDDYSGPDSRTWNRTWYDGLGYRAIPEPAAGVLLAIGLAGIIRRAPRASCR
jgi:hypothetical protein